MSLRSLPSKVSSLLPRPHSHSHHTTHQSILSLSPLPSVDWDDSQTDLAHLGGVAPGAAKSEGDKLWEDNWDDDDIEEEFSVQLR
jgi:26 proteasome complex subunit DSS1